MSARSVLRRLLHTRQFSSVTMFGHIQPGPPDPMFTLKKNADNDRSLEKIDLGVGIYRNEAGSYQELEVVRQVNGS